MRYELDYFEFLLKKDCKTAEQIAKIRWDFLKSINPRVVLDFGSGVGWFRAYRPRDIIVDTYDIGQFPQTGIQHAEYDLVCFWDVIEHIPDLGIIIDVVSRTNYLALTVPIKPKRIAWKDWHHFRPFHHLHWFDLELLDALLGHLGFKRIKCEQSECPPRKDIFSLIYERNDKALPYNDWEG